MGWVLLVKGDTMYQHFEYIFLIIFAGIFVTFAQRAKAKDGVSHTMTTLQGFTYLGIFLSFLIWGLTEDQKLYTISAIIFVAVATTIVLIMTLKYNSELDQGTNVFQTKIPVLSIFISLFMNWGIGIVYTLWRLQLLEKFS